jgi:DNA-binding response OmpR family regulator
MKILVCEDDNVVLKVIQVALEEEKMEGVFVNDGRKALAILTQNNDFDGIITDIHMPFHNGDEILHLVREVQKSTIPIIMISSDTQEEVITLALKLGVDSFIGKPLDPKDLSKIFRKVLRGKTTQR